MSGLLAIVLLVFLLTGVFFFTFAAAECGMMERETARVQGHATDEKGRMTEPDRMMRMCPRCEIMRKEQMTEKCPECGMIGQKDMGRDGKTGSGQPGHSGMPSGSGAHY